MAGFIQRLVGYAITGETREQCFAVHHGQGANGKSVFTNTLSRVFGGVTKTTPFSTFEAKNGDGIPNDVAALRGARLVLASEGERGKPMAEAVIKRVTGQDEITARFLRQEFFTFRPSFLIMMSSNHLPSFRSVDEGLWRRVKLIPWKRYFEPDERDHSLEFQLEQEAEGILAWAVRGAQEWYAGGLDDPPMIVGATSSYRTNSDPLADFLAAEGPLRHTGDRSDMERSPDVYRAYLDWAEAEELPSKDIWGRNAVYSALQERGLERGRAASGPLKDKNVFFGVTLYAEPEPAPDPDTDIFGGKKK